MSDENGNIMEHTMDFLKNLYLQNKEEIDRAAKKYREQFYELNRNCQTCENAKDGKCAGTEKCHECMWDSQYK